MRAIGGGRKPARLIRANQSPSDELPLDLSRFDADSGECQITMAFSFRLDGGNTQVANLVEGDAIQLDLDWMIAPGNTSPPEFFLNVDRTLGCNDGIDLGAGLTRFEMIEVPEPSASALGVAGIAAVGIVAWKRRSHRVGANRLVQVADVMLPDSRDRPAPIRS